MNNLHHYKSLFFVGILALVLHACVPVKDIRKAQTHVPENYGTTPIDSVNTAKTSWKQFFADPYLIALIDTALVRNQELNIMTQSVALFENQIQAKKGEYLPFVNIKGSADVEKVGKHTRNGAVEESLHIDGEEFPEPLRNYSVGLVASWELDIWKQLRNEKKAAVLEYLSSVEGKNFMITNLVAEIADAYYELMALDNQLDILHQNLQLQQNALKILKLQKEAAKTTELAVRRFTAELQKTQSETFEIAQRITETENKINFLIGKTPSKISRNSASFLNIPIDSVYAGIPSQLLENRTDIKKASLELEASKLNTKVAKANFYPSLGISAGVGLNAFKTGLLTKTPESLVYSFAGDIVGPIINRNAIKALYKNANSKQIQAIFEYEKTILNGYIEVANELSNIQNLKNVYAFKEGQVTTLTESITLSTRLFTSARADYLEVLLTQREALEAKIALVATKKDQLMANIHLYKFLGGGWQ
ncbi:TolC family protein [Polaribacter sp.]|uniref:TolC family protein n=1 Tax=Polaribacter sp. TaxID=1920175 RepID=UPI00404722C0